MGCWGNYPTQYAEMLAAGGGAHFDFANVHHFSSFASLWSSYRVDIAGKFGRPHPRHHGRAPGEQAHYGHGGELDERRQLGAPGPLLYIWFR
ncbi:MAG: hypothetical protein ACYC4L_12255 [Chloroflexota bacterium]